MFDDARIRLEGRLELLETVARDATLSLQGLERGELINLVESVRALKSSSIARAEHHALRFAQQSEAVGSTLASLAVLRLQLPALIRRRARALVLSDDGTDEEVASRLVADPIRRFTMLDWPPAGPVTRRAAVLGAASLAATQAALFVDRNLAVCVAVASVGAWLWFLAAHAAFLRGPIILTRSRLIVGRRAHAISNMRRISVAVHSPAMEILHEDATVTTLRPPSWLAAELRGYGIPCEKFWRGIPIS